MNSDDELPIYPYRWPWENFEPIEVTLGSLREDPVYFLRLQAARDEQLIRAELSRPNFAKIAEELALNDARRARLAFDFELIASWYTGPGVQNALDVDVIACRRELSRAVKAASDLRSALMQINTMIGPTFLHLHPRSSAHNAGGGSVVFDNLENELSQIERVAGTLAGALESKGPGSPGVFFWNTAVSLICEALLEAGADLVTTSHGKGGRAGTHFHFSNASGRALLALFKMLDHRLDERLLVRSFEFLRAESRKANLTKNSPKEA